MKIIFTLFLTAISCFGAVGSWNGVAFTHWNGVAQTGWNGTSISCAGGGGGPDVFYYGGAGNVEGGFTSSGNSSWAPQTFSYGGTITVATGGTCTIISAKIGVASGSITAKIGLYDNSNNLVASGTTASFSGAGAWRDVAISQAVSAGTYKILYSCSSDQGVVYFDNAETGIYDEVAYGSFPAATITPSNEVNSLYGVRMYVD